MSQEIMNYEADCIIRTDNLCKQYGEVAAVRGLNLSIRRGEVFGLLGPNGAGKTTTTLMLLGLTDPSSGHAYIDGMDCTRDSLAIKKEVGYLPDSVGFYGDMTGMENLVFSGMMNGLSREAARTRAKMLLERVGMTYAASRKAGTYSRGMRQRLGIADVLMKDPKIIIMDEPTLGIDPEGMRELTTLIRELSVKDGRTLLISSHDLYQIQKISDRVGIFVKGSMIACGRIEELGRQLENEGLFMLDIRAEREDGAEDAEGDALSRLLRGITGIRLIGKREDGSLHIESNRDIRRELLSLLSSQQYVLQEMHQRGGDLDEIYRKYFERGEDAYDSVKGSTPGDGETSGIKGRLQKLLHRAS